MRRKLAAGNWKMNGTRADLSVLGDLAGAATEDGPEVLICPPATLLHPAATQALGTGIVIGAQTCHEAASGAFTGDISAPMVADAGATHVILGHSERREGYGETNADVANKVRAAWAADLTAIVCVGESLEDREGGTALAVISEQLAYSLPNGATGQRLVVAYEPIWAIGTGKVPSTAQIAEVHDALRAQLGDRFGAATGAAVRLLYGGSVKPDNAAEIFATSNVDGALVGGASLTAADFTPIIAALARA